MRHFIDSLHEVYFLLRKHEHLRFGSPSRMHENTATPNSEESPKTTVSPWKLIGWICAGVISASVIGCIVMAVVRSDGLTKVTVTALKQADEPRDHNLPLFKKKEALPDYQIVLMLSNGVKVRLGTKPDTSAVDGLVWEVNDPVSIADISSVQLQEVDKLISDSLAEVQITGDTITEKNYRFNFVTRRSFSVGVKSFFGTPIGLSIMAGFCIAIILLVVGFFRI
jgi:hypothetical protein